MDNTSLSAEPTSNTANAPTGYDVGEINIYICKPYILLIIC